MNTFKKYLFNNFFYVLCIILLITSFVIYIVWVEPNLHETLEQNKDEIVKQEVVYYIMDQAPFIWINLVGLLMAAINTFIYCTSNTITESEVFKKGSLLISFVLIVAIGIVAYNCYSQTTGFIKELPTGSVAESIEYNNSILSRIKDTFSGFYNEVTICTYLTFIYFLILDLIHLKRTSSHAGQEYLIEHKYAQMQLWMIDITVLASTSIILLFNHFLDKSFRSTSICDENNPFIFITGASGMQIVYSQIVFFILVSFMFFEKEKASRT